MAKKLHISRDAIFREGSRYQDLRGGSDLEDHFVSIPLDTVLPTERLLTQVHEPAGDVNSQQQRLRVSDAEPEAPGPVQEQTPLPAAIPVPRAIGKGSRMLNELASDLGPAFGIPGSGRKGRRMRTRGRLPAEEKEGEEQDSYAIVNAYASTIDYHDGIHRPRSYSEATKAPHSDAEYCVLPRNRSGAIHPRGKRWQIREAGNRRLPAWGSVGT